MLASPSRVEGSSKWDIPSLSGLAQLASNVALPRGMSMGIGSPSIASMHSSGGNEIGQRHVAAAVAWPKWKGSRASIE